MALKNLNTAQSQEIYLANCNMIIIATIGIKTTKEKLRKIILAGADAFRFNFSRYSVEENISMVVAAQEIVDELNSSVKIVIDLPTNKIRVGDFDIKSFSVREGEEFIFKSGQYTLDCNEFIPVNINSLGDKVNNHQTISLGDGEISIKVTEIIDQDTMKAVALNNGIIQSLRPFNIPHRIKNEDFITTCKQTIELTNFVNAEFIAVSYIDSQINSIIKEKLNFKRMNKKVIIKIEDQNGIDDIERIMQDPYYDLILLDRGEIGTNIPFQRMGIIQNNIIKIAKKYNRPVLISTQILESTINNYIPSRAEISDLTYLTLSDIKGIVLCKETGINSRPAYTISTAKKIINEAEMYKKSVT